MSTDCQKNWKLQTDSEQRKAIDTRKVTSVTRSASASQNLQGLLQLHQPTYNLDTHKAREQEEAEDEDEEEDYDIDYLLNSIATTRTDQDCNDNSNLNSSNKNDKILLQENEFNDKQEPLYVTIYI